MLWLLAHCFAIIWINLGSNDDVHAWSTHQIQYEKGGLYCTEFNVDVVDCQPTKYKQYIFALYWVLTCISTVGYGDYTPGTT